jgi:hypothetical protein
MEDITKEEREIHQINCELLNLLKEMNNTAYKYCPDYLVQK